MKHNVFAGLAMFAMATLSVHAIADCKKGPGYHWDEAKNPAGSNQCTNSCQCDGARTCSPYGWCQGKARPDGHARVFEGVYRLKTVFQGSNHSLEGNQAGSPDHKGAAFMNNLQNVSGQFWKIVSDGPYYRLKTEFQGPSKSLEGNAANSPVHGGSAFMNNSQNVSGQLWQIVPEGNYFRLKTVFQGPSKCLEGNQAGSPVHNGNAFMNDCQNVSGQLWIIDRVR